MSDLRPRGIPIMLDGVERHFLFTLNAIDAAQDKLGKSMQEIMENLREGDDFEHTTRDLTFILINDEAERERFKNPESELKEVTEKEAGWMIGTDNIIQVMGTIMAAYGYSLPEAEDEDPNRKSGQQSR